MPDLVASQEVAGESAGSGVTALDAGHRITGPSPATRPDSECGSPASRTAALLAGSDELPAGCQTQSAATDNGTPDEGSNAGDIGRESDDA